MNAPVIHGERTSKFGAYEDDLPIFDWIRDGAPERRSCLEAQVMDLADDISYSVHDVEDAIVAGHFQLRWMDNPDHRARVVGLRQAVVPAAATIPPRSTPPWPGWRPRTSGCARPTAAASPWRR